VETERLEREAAMAAAVARAGRTATARVAVMDLPRPALTAVAVAVAGTVAALLVRVERQHPAVMAGTTRPALVVVPGERVQPGRGPTAAMVAVLAARCRLVMLRLLGQ
jgi:hypothetical protein